MKPVYPLKQVIEVKKRRVEDAEKMVLAKKEALNKEEERLKEREADRDKVKKHYNDKMKQMREEMDHGTTSPKIQQMKVYSKVVEEKLKAEEKKVQDQKEQVKIAEKNLEAAKEELKRKRMEVDKLLTHKVDWEKEMRKEEEIQEGREQDEIGSVMHLIHKRRR
ncbi:MAG: type III secretion T3S chaperone [Parachlamydiaceae bacterium]